MGIGAASAARREARRRRGARAAGVALAATLAAGCGTVSTATAVVGAAGSAVVTGATAIGSGVAAAGSTVLDAGGTVVSLGSDAVSAAAGAASAATAAPVPANAGGGTAAQAVTAAEAASEAARAGRAGPATPGGVEVATLSGRPVGPGDPSALVQEPSSPGEGPEARRFRLVSDATEGAKSCLSHLFDLDSALSALGAAGFETARRADGDDETASATRGAVRVALSPGAGLCLVSADRMALQLARTAAARALDEAFGRDWTLLEATPSPDGCAPMRVETPGGTFDVDFPTLGGCAPTVPAGVRIAATGAA